MDDRKPLESFQRDYICVSLVVSNMVRDTGKLRISDRQVTIKIVQICEPEWGQQQRECT